MSKRIVFLITGLGLGGAETQLVQLAQRLHRRGWKVTVVSMIPASERAKELEQNGIPVLSLNMKPGTANLRALYGLAAILRREQPQVLHAHMVHANLLARATRLLVRVPLIISTAHNINEGARWREVAYRLTDPLGDITTQVSQAGLERYVSVGAAPKERIIFMANGVDTAQFRPNPEVRSAKRKELGLDQAFIWLAIGRLTEAKDYPNLLHAFAKVAAQEPTARLLVAGKGELEEELKQLQTQLGLGQAVQFLGPRSDVPALMNAADAYVMSSAWEGMPMVLLESAANALPIVTTDVGGNREVVEDGKTGYLVPAKNADALAQAMTRLMQLSPEARTQMGLAGRRFIEQHYDLEGVVDRWEQLFEERLKKGSRAVL